MSDRKTAVPGVDGARSLVFGLLTTSITALAHSAAGGAVPTLPGLAVLALTTSATAWPVLRRAWRPAALFTVVGAAQVALHPAFQALAAPAGHAGHPATPLMVVVHLAAGLGVVALVLAVDPVIRRWAADRVQRRVPVPVTGPGIVPILWPPASPVPARVVTDAPRRGPPPGGAVAPPLAAPGASGCPTPLPMRSSVVSKSLLRAGARAAVVVAGVGALTLGGALAASAHVSVIANTTAAGSYALLTFGVPHGCDGSSTTKVAIKIPEEINAVTPTVNPNWEVEKVMVPLNPAITDSHGNQITERVDQVVYTAKTPLPDGYRDAFVLSLKVPDVAGETLSFPTIQTCEVGETAWIEPTVEGQDEPDHPAPEFDVTAAAAAGDDHGAAATTAAAAANSSAAAPTSSAEVAATASTSDSGSTSWVAIAGLVAGVLGLVVGGVALARSRRA